MAMASPMPRWKWVTDRQFGDGINVMVPMARPLHHDARAYLRHHVEPRLGQPQLAALQDVCRLRPRSYLSTPAVATGRGALYPASSLWVEADPAIAKSFHSVMDLLKRRRSTSIIVDEDLAGALGESGTLRIGVQAYRAVVLSDTRALWGGGGTPGRVQEAGGAVAAVDRPPWLCAEAEHQAEFKPALGALFL